MGCACLALSQGLLDYWVVRVIVYAKVLSLSDFSILVTFNRINVHKKRESVNTFPSDTRQYQFLDLKRLLLAFHYSTSN